MHTDLINIFKDFRISFCLAMSLPSSSFFTTFFLTYSRIPVLLWFARQVGVIPKPAAKSFMKENIIMKKVG